MQRRVVFLDRDGTINVDHRYVSHPDDWEFTPRAVEAVRLLKDAGFAVAVVTNQSGVGEGLYSIEDVRRLHEFMQGELGKAGTSLDAIAFCPHGRNEGCKCRKPATGMAVLIAEQLGAGIDYSASWTIGDKPTDVQFGQRLGTKALLIRSHYWDAVEMTLQPEIITNSLHDAVRRILECHPSRLA